MDNPSKEAASAAAGKDVTASSSSLCTQGCGFFGNAQFNNMCSKCFQMNTHTHSHNAKNSSGSKSAKTAPKDKKSSSTTLRPPLISGAADTAAAVPPSSMATAAAENTNSASQQHHHQMHKQLLPSSSVASSIASSVAALQPQQHHHTAGSSHTQTHSHVLQSGLTKRSLSSLIESEAGASSSSSNSTSSECVLVPVIPLTSSASGVPSLSPPPHHTVQQQNKPSDCKKLKYELPARYFGSDTSASSVIPADPLPPDLNRLFASPVSALSPDFCLTESSESTLEESQSSCATPFTSSNSVTQIFATHKKHRERCFACKKKIGLTAFSCRCGHKFCAAHRYSDTHGCEFDYQSAGQAEIRDKNPLIRSNKLDKL